ncbi:MAG: tol-pal system protein YbgF [Thermoanaerobaculia bacterium]
MNRNFRSALSLVRFGAPLVGALVLGGCVSGSDIERLHSHINDVQKQVDTVAKQSSSKDEVAKLNDNLTKQAATLLRSNADIGTRFEELIREMQTLAGKLEDANRRLAQLSQQIADTSGRLASAAPPQGSVILAGPPTGSTVTINPPGTSPMGGAGSPAGGSASAGTGRGPSAADLFAQSSADYQRGQYDLSRQGFEEYLQTYGKTDLSDDAAYWIGECYSAQKKPREAIAAWDRLFKMYPQSDKSAAGHLKRGLAHLELGEKAQAIVQLQFVVHEYPGSDEAKSARQRLRGLGSDAR